jgi:hypothetical protein
MSAPRTDRQAWFITNLLSERLVTLGAEDIADATAKVHLNDLTVADAKVVIDRLLKVPKDPDPTMPAVVAESPRSGINDRPDTCAGCGHPVEARAGFYYKAGAGWLVHHKVGECRTEPAPEPVKVEQGFYVIDTGNGLDVDDLAEVDVYKLYVTRNGYLAAKVLDDYAWQYRTGGVSVVRSALSKGKARRLTAEEAAAFGKITGTCIACGLKLTDDGKNKSLEVGYGPVCAKKNGWPWG